MSNGNVFDNRRKYNRNTFALDVYVYSNDFGDDTPGTRVRDISLEGIAIDRPHLGLKTDHTVTLCFSGADECDLSKVILARVMHADEVKLGLKFEMVGTEVISILRSLLN
ncbi:PilZ domain-containing protein [Candidatus Pacearchaeota archaeon]|nr:PilZ domain-containing protein [Candidatus Pacearchaeota archaeon]